MAKYSVLQEGKVQKFVNAVCITLLFSGDLARENHKPCCLLLSVAVAGVGVKKAWCSQKEIAPGFRF